MQPSTQHSQQSKPTINKCKQPSNRTNISFNKSMRYRANLLPSRPSSHPSNPHLNKRISPRPSNKHTTNRLPHSNSTNSSIIITVAAAAMEDAEDEEDEEDEEEDAVEEEKE